MEKVIIKVKKETAEYLEDLLEREDIDFSEEGIDEDSTIETFTAKFSNGYEADIKVCSGEHNCYVDPVLFNANGCQIGLLEPDYELLGEYTFEVENEEYTVILELE